MSSIPLAANNLRIPEQPNALDQYARIMQIKSAQQNQQIQQQEIQKNQMALQDQNIGRKAFLEANGDLDKTVQLAAKYGMSPQGVQQLQLHSVDVKTKTADLVSKQGANALQQADLMQGAHDAVDKAPAEQRPVIYQQQLQALQQRGIDVSQLPPQYPGDDQFKLIGATVQGHKQQVEDVLKQTEGAKNSAQATEAGARTDEVKANTAKIKAEMDFYQKRGLAPGVPLDAQEAADWMQKNPGKGPAEFMKMKAGLAAQANATAQAGLLTDSAKQMAAQNYAQTGQLPSGLRSPAMSAQVLNTAASGPGGIPNIAANKANYKADSGSLASLQKNFDQVTAFENTAGKNLDVFLGQAQKVIDSGNPLINRPLRAITGSMGGTDQAAFDAARTTALTEISKVLNSSNASGVLSDSARHEVEGLIKPNATLQQIVSAANILKTDMANRHQAYQEQLNAIKGRTGGGSQQAPSGKISVTAPDGSVHPFDTQAQADAFKKLAHIQ